MYRVLLDGESHSSKRQTLDWIRSRAILKSESAIPHLLSPRERIEVRGNKTIFFSIAKIRETFNSSKTTLKFKLSPTPFPGNLCALCSR